jgi:hypothetical protein
MVVVVRVGAVAGGAGAAAMMVPFKTAGALDGAQVGAACRST